MAPHPPISNDTHPLSPHTTLFLSVGPSHYFTDPRLDGIASIIIGIILALVATLLARESKGLLIGERADNDVIRAVHRVVTAYPAVSSVNHVRTIHTAPDKVFVAISVDRSEEHTSELQSLMRITYAVFSLK